MQGNRKLGFQWWKNGPGCLLDTTTLFSISFLNFLKRSNEQLILVGAHVSLRHPVEPSPVRLMTTCCDPEATSLSGGTPMINWQRSKHRRSDMRRGTTTVETAMVLPVFLLFVLAIIEFGHVQLVNNMLRSATRTAARFGSTEGNTTSQVEAHVRSILSAVMDSSDVDVLVKDAGVYDTGGTPPETSTEIEALPGIELANAEPRQLFLVRATIDYIDIAIVPIHIPYLGTFLDNVVLEGQAFTRHE